MFLDKCHYGHNLVSTDNGHQNLHANKIFLAGEIVTNSNTLNLNLTKADLINASRNIKPTAMKEVTIEVPKVSKKNSFLIV